MCLIDSSTCMLSNESNELIENSVSEETFSIISSENKPYHFKFKIVDFFNSLGNH